MTIHFEYHYRRRHLSGPIGIATASGEMLVQRDDPAAFVVDYLWSGPRYTEPVTGRRGTGTATIARPPAAALRLWLWPERPLRLLEHVDAAGQTLLYRIDFATPPHRLGNACYQTDLYLDLFASPDEKDYAILDEDELEIATERQLITPELSDRIKRELEQLVARLEARRLRAWLHGICAAPYSAERLSTAPDWLYQEIDPGAAGAWPEDVA
ncbi:MAG TPA: DUF402 domain-containing protein [Herpetosiphonaceae bacterium]